MCGAIALDYCDDLASKVAPYVSQGKIKEYKRKGQIIFAFWHPMPILPVKKGKEIVILPWGNRQQETGLPKTGWARLESLQAKKWDYLQPKVVLIPASQGCEKKVWFDLSYDIKGVLVRYQNRLLVYMITEPASLEYSKLTGHHRMPRLFKK